MSLAQRIQDDTKRALLSGDSFTTEVLRGLKSVILNEEIAQGKRETGLDDATIEQLLAKEVKKRGESAELFEQGGNVTAAEKERREKELILQYLPQQLSEEEVRAMVVQVIHDTNAENTQAMGKVIGAVRAEAGSQADGAMIARIAKEELNKKS